MSRIDDIVKATPWDLRLYEPFVTAKYTRDFYRANPDYFDPDGIWVFCGPQGSGKTLSAVRTVQLLKKQYPKVKIVSNLDVNLPYTLFTSYDQLATETNGLEGIVFLIDEIHVLWNSLESKSIPISEMGVFAQMRKDRRVIIGTSQVYSRIAKPIREQLKYVIDCHCIGGLLQVNDVLDCQAASISAQGTLDAPVIRKELFWHTRELYESFETLTKIKRLQRVSRLGDLYHG